MPHHVRAYIGLLASSLMLLGLGAGPAAAVEHQNEGTGQPFSAAAESGPPPAAGYFRTRAVGSWDRLPSGRRCTARVHRSAWEPRPDNAVPNSRMPRAKRVHAAFAARPVAIENAYEPRWDTWLLQRVSGRFTGTTDEIFQWAACKWGIADNVLRAVAVRESTWYQYDVYPDGSCVLHYSCGDVVVPPDPSDPEYAAKYAANVEFCTGLAAYGRDYQLDYAPGVCPRTFGITGVMSWQAPSWGHMPGNQNGTFPFNVRSTAFAVDYLASQLRGCHEGWEWWLGNTGTRTYEAGRLWGCVGAWFAGEWRSEEALGYISRVKAELRARTWLQPEWPEVRPPCDPILGCPQGLPTQEPTASTAGPRSNRETPVSR